MATCGPSNALTNLGKHASRDATLQRESAHAPASINGGGFRSRPAANESAFQAFTTAGPPQAFQEMPRVAAQVPTQFHAPHAPAAASSEWAQQFANLSVSDPVMRGNPQHQRPRFVSPEVTAGMFPAMDHQYNYPMRAAPVPLPQQPCAVSRNSNLPAASTNEAFDKAFAAVDQFLESAKPVEQEPTVAPAVGEDLSEAAQSVLNTVSQSAADDTTKEKIKSSKFMALLGQLSSSEVKATNDNFVDSSGNVIDPHTLHNAPVIDSADNSLNNPLNCSVNNSVNATGVQRPLEDPFAYLERLKSNGKFLSPLDEANNHGPIQVSSAAWEEHYDDAVWVT